MLKKLVKIKTLDETKKVCLELLAEAGTSWDEFDVRRQCIPGMSSFHIIYCSCYNYKLPDHLLTASAYEFTKD